MVWYDISYGLCPIKIYIKQVILIGIAKTQEITIHFVLYVLLLSFLIGSHKKLISYGLVPPHYFSIFSVLRYLSII